MVRQLFIKSRWTGIFILSGMWGLLAPASQAQSYRVYRPVAQGYEEKVSAPRISLFEIEAASVLSVGDIQDAEDHSISRKMPGWQGRGFFYLNQIFAAGFAVEQSQAMDMQTRALTAFKRTEYHLLFKLMLTPNTEPQLYLLAGVGRADQHSRFKRQYRRFHQDSWVWVVGMGGNVRLWKNLSLFGDYSLHYDREKWDNFLFEGPRLRQEGTVGLSYQF